jgi:hypothetical protein
MRHTRLASWTARAAIAVAGLVATAAIAGAADGSLACYVETMTLHANGNAQVRIVVDIPAGGAGPLVLPLASPNITSLTAEGAAPSAVTVETRGDRPVLVVTYAVSAAPQTLAISYGRPSLVDMTAPSLAFGNRGIAYDFVNTTGAAIADFKAAIVLPPGFGVTAVERVLPAVPEASVSLPYEIGEAGGQVTVTLTGRDVPIGGAEALGLRVKPRGSPLPITGGALLLAVWYLVRFRDRVRRDVKA